MFFVIKYIRYRFIRRQIRGALAGMDKAELEQVLERMKKKMNA